MAHGCIFFQILEYYLFVEDGELGKNPRYTFVPKPK